MSHPQTCLTDPRGAIWRKWDLHVHTPASLVQRYGGDTPEAWERFFTAIEQLPPEFKVLGINDYLFLDGYRKVLEARRTGRLGNIDLVLPIIEFRIDKFGGTDSRLSRVNFHVVFSNEIDTEVIQHQFLNALPHKYQLTAAYAHLQSSWNALPTITSLADLGRRIIASVPPDRRHQFGSPLEEGFNNLNFRLEDIQRALESHYFADRYLLGVGKTEWEAIKWNDQSIAEKKHVINQAAFIFTAAASVSDWRRSWDGLRQAGIDSYQRLLDCSDAHTFAEVAEKDRLGNCFTWIKADTTFRGLRQALKEPEERIHIGELPPKVVLVKQNRTKYIRSLSIRKRPGVTIDDTWFDNTLRFNHDLVAIIGNKGNGKSALTDIIALLGNAQCTDFSFLSKERFRHPRNGKAEHFDALIEWENDTRVERSLAMDTLPVEVPLVKYIPQQFFERICNETVAREDGSFDREMKAVIFSHVAEADRLGQDSLDSLITYRTEEIEVRIRQLQSEIHGLNGTIIELERQTSTESIATLKRLIEQKNLEIGAHNGERPPDLPPPLDGSQLAATVSSLRSLLENLRVRIDTQESRIKEAKRRSMAAAKVRGKIDNFLEEFRRLQDDCAGDLQLLGVDSKNLITVSVTLGQLEQLEVTADQEMREATALLDPQHQASLSTMKQDAEAQLEDLTSQMAEVGRAYQYRLQELQDWEGRAADLVGTAEEVGSLCYYEHQLAAATGTLPEHLAEVRAQRRSKVSVIYSAIQKLAETQRDLYRPVQEFINTHGLTKDKYNLHFGVKVTELGFVDRFIGFINQGVKGSFYGAEDGRRFIEEMLERHDANEEADLLAFLGEVLDSLARDRRDPAGRPTSVTRQLRKGVTPQELYDFLFSLEYLRPKYELTLGDKALPQLSPGERGVVLLVFYLLIDKNDCPLLIDQPEENLDSQSVFELLVPCIKAAKRRRQLFIVTHDPNLAVVCDAEQIIAASIDKKDKNRVSYLSGAIEDPTINSRLLDVLEGTRPAFRNRESKYIDL